MAKRTRRSFTAQFKAEVVLAVLTGAQSQAELCRAHGLKPELVALWKKTFRERLPSVFDGTTRDGPEAARVAELGAARRPPDPGAGSRKKSLGLAPLGAPQRRGGS
jgi:transposase-like protein